jgi:hypothetical protein
MLWKAIYQTSYELNDIACSSKCICYDLKGETMHIWSINNLLQETHKLQVLVCNQSWYV